MKYQLKKKNKNIEKLREQIFYNLEKSPKLHATRDLWKHCIPIWLIIVYEKYTFLIEIKMNSPTLYGNKDILSEDWIVRFKAKKNCVFWTKLCLDTTRHVGCCQKNEAVSARSSIIFGNAKNKSVNEVFPMLSLLVAGWCLCLYEINSRWYELFWGSIENGISIKRRVSEIGFPRFPKTIIENERIFKPKIQRIATQINRKKSNLNSNLTFDHRRAFNTAWAVIIKFDMLQLVAIVFAYHFCRLRCVASKQFAYSHHCYGKQSEHTQQSSLPFIERRRHEFCWIYII